MDETFLMERAQVLTPSVTSSVAVHVSENTATASNWKYDSWKPWQISQFMTRALKSDGTRFDILTDAQIESGSLSSGGNARYPILISLANEAVSDAVVNQIRTFVNNGGHAYVGSSSFTRRADGTERGNFALSSEMGLVSRGSWQLTNDVIRVASTPLADVLPLNAPQWHFLPLRRDVTDFPAGFVSDLRTDFRDAAPNQTFYGSRPIHEGSHWFWDVVPTTSGGATVLVKPWPQLGIDDRMTLTSSTAPAGFSESIFATAWSAAYDIQVADVNGDRRADLVGRRATTGDLQVGLSTGQGFAPSSSWGSFGSNFQLWLADVDGDGDADLVGRSTSRSDVQVALSAGKQGTLAFQASTHWTNWDQSYDLWLADVDGDGDADLVGRPKSGGTDVQVGRSLGKQGTNAFQASTPWTSWSQTYTLLLGDVDGDGDADIVGRPKSAGTDVQVSLSLGKQGTSAFQASTRWTDWGQSYELRLGDASGDGKVDLIGHRLLGGTTAHDDVVVAASLGSGFQAPSPRWGFWEQGPSSCDNGPCDSSKCQCDSITCPAPGVRQYDPFLGDVNGDGRVDLLGRGIVTPSNVALWINKGPVTGIDTTSRPGYGALLAEKSYGSGKFVYNANLQAFAGYGGDSRILSEYQSLRSAIDAAFAARDEALVRVSPWPYPFRAAFIYRHDHVLNTPIVEKETACGISGEYYIQPDVTNSSTDYPTFVHWATAEVGRHGIMNRAIIGAHQLCHRWPDEAVEDVALGRLTSTIDSIRGATGLTPENFVAPGYIALRKSSLNAIARAGLVTAGEQGFSPFPAFAVDPEVNADLPGSLLELPIIGIIRQLENLTWPELCKNIDTVYAQNGLLNVYDHGGQGTGGLAAGAEDARQYLKYVFGPGAAGSACEEVLQGPGPSGCGPGLGGTDQTIWKTTSSKIRNWWLLRETKSLSVTQTATATRATINVSIATGSARATSSHSVSDMSLRIRLSPSLITLANQGISIVLTGASGSEHERQGNDQLVVRVKNATAAQIILGT